MPLTIRHTELQSPAHKDWLDYTVYEAGKPVGRLYEDRDAGTPPELRWFWSIMAGVDPMTGIVTSGKVATLEEAKKQFRANWERVKGNH
jgi:hypothetical protein